MSRPILPPRSVLVVVAVVALVAACSGGDGAGASAPPPDDSDAPAGAASAATTIKLADYAIRPAEVTVGPDFVLAISNFGPTPHNLTIRDESGAVGDAISEIEAGGSALLQGHLEPGRYITFCSLPGHENMGMRALLIVGA